MIVCPRFVRGILPLSVARPVRDRQASALLPGCGDHASAIMRMLKDGLISIVAAVRHRPQVMAIPDFGPCRWRLGHGGMEGQVGPFEDAGMWASSLHTTQSGSARSRMGSHLRPPVQLGPIAALGKAWGSHCVSASV